MYKILLFLLLLLSFRINAIQEKIWELALPGKVISIPVERRNQEIILICEDRHVYCLNTLDGIIKWKYKPGGKLEQLKISSDGSIIVKDRNTLYSIFGNGDLRWKVEFKKDLESDFAIDQKGYIYTLSNKVLYSINRFGVKNIVKKSFDADTVWTLNNYLIAYSSRGNIIAQTYNGDVAWEYQIPNSIRFIEIHDSGFYIVTTNNWVYHILNDGEMLKNWSIDGNIELVTTNLNGNLLIKTDDNSLIIENGEIREQSIDDFLGLYYSNGLLIQAYDDWHITGTSTDQECIFYPSGRFQINKRNISLSHKNVWGDQKLKSFYTNLILDGNRALQLEVLNIVKNRLDDFEILGLIPNFYDILILLSSEQNKNEDIRQKAYIEMGKSQDISFIPYLISDLDNESSYHILPYIIYAIGNIRVDISGDAIRIINRKLDDFYDESLVINALYALYKLNQYSNNEHIDKVFIGIEKILYGGYSSNVELKCYEILDKMK